MFQILFLNFFFLITFCPRLLYFLCVFKCSLKSVNLHVDTLCFLRPWEAVLTNMLSTTTAHCVKAFCAEAVLTILVVFHISQQHQQGEEGDFHTQLLINLKKQLAFFNWCWWECVGVWWKLIITTRQSYMLILHVLDGGDTENTTAKRFAQSATVRLWSISTDTGGGKKYQIHTGHMLGEFLN